ncbi:NIPSNAP family protein [Paraburkholderia tropica]|uniref:NIPSNAP family protein n=1 Tax=Paraburkholderia tropica TaxID=92647 RepID=UPI002AB1BCBC|nr:NIPSNAP family protein [Paraburkholderia tropica]
MIVEHRTYMLHPGKVPTYLSLYEDEGMPIQLGYLVQPLGYYVSELGTLNQIIHLWGYEDLNDRMCQRNRLKSDPRWMPYVNKILPLIQQQESKILTPASFYTPSAVSYQRR